MLYTTMALEMDGSFCSRNNDQLGSASNWETPRHIPPLFANLENIAEVPHSEVTWESSVEEHNITNTIQPEQCEKVQQESEIVGPFWFRLIRQEETQVPASTKHQSPSPERESYVVEEVDGEDEGAMVAINDFPWELSEKALMADEPPVAEPPEPQKPAPAHNPPAPAPRQPNLDNAQDNNPRAPLEQPLGQRRRRHNSQARRERNYARMQMFRARKAARPRETPKPIPKPPLTSTYIPSLFNIRV
jgi:hypothetical protein